MLSMTGVSEEIWLIVADATSMQTVGRARLWRAHGGLPFTPLSCHDKALHVVSNTTLLLYNMHNITRENPSKPPKETHTRHGELKRTWAPTPPFGQYGKLKALAVHCRPQYPCQSQHLQTHHQKPSLPSPDFRFRPVPCSRFPHHIPIVPLLRCRGC